MQHVARFCQRHLIPVFDVTCGPEGSRSWFVELSESLPICYFYGQLGSNIQRLLTAKASQQVGEMSCGWLSGRHNIHLLCLAFVISLAALALNLCSLSM